MFFAVVSGQSKKIIKLKKSFRVFDLKKCFHLYFAIREARVEFRKIKLKVCASKIFCFL